MSTARARRPVTRLAAVTYETYVRLRDARGNRGLRMAYHDGVLEIMSPEFRHDLSARHLYEIVAAYCGGLKIDWQPAGSTTFRKGEPGRRVGKGKEADESFFIGERAVQAILGKHTLDLNVDPPPSLWVEVDNWGSSRARLPLYAGLGVPEVWRYRPRRRTLWIGRLVDGGGDYAAVNASVVLPGLAASVIVEALEKLETLSMAAGRVYLAGDWFPRHRQGFVQASNGPG